MRAFVLSVLIIVSSCANSKGVPYIKIVGQISEQTVRLLEEAPAGVTTVVITSQGGDTVAAIAAARIIRKRGYELEVRRYCLSACAQLILPAAKKATLIDLPIIGMHHSSTAFQALLLSDGNREEADKYAAVARLEQSFYDEIGVDRNMLTYPYSQTVPLCYFSSSDASQPFAQFAAKWNFVALSAETYKKFTKSLPQGRWPETREELLEMGARHIPSTASTSIVPENPDMRPNGIFLDRNISKRRLINARVRSVVD